MSTAGFGRDLLHRGDVTIRPAPCENGVPIASSAQFLATFQDTSLSGRAYFSMDSSPRCCWTHVVDPMVAAGLCIGLDGVGHVFPPYFIPPETKIKVARYQDMLRSCYDPWAKTFLR